MAGKVLLVNHGNALMANTLKNLLKEMEIETVHVEPDMNKAAQEIDSADAVMIFAGDFIYDSPELLVYLKDACFGENRPLCIMGNEKEIDEIEGSIPKTMIAHEFQRPVDVKSISAALCQLVHAGESRKQEKHIMLVDDDTLFLQAMQNWLGTRYKVTATKSGMQAITYIANNRPDLILLDYDMPITSGPQVLEMIRSEPKSADIPVIFLTGRNDRESVMKVMQLKPDGYLLKSMTKENIVASVDKFFETRKWENLYN
ncbi:MAG: response regulator [Ruminococcaceae bacterium]|nr:response regulator [Oscillospiraceae bacterium]